MYISPETMSMVREDLGKAGANISAIAHKYGIPLRILREKLETPPPLPPATQKHGGLGRPELQQFAIARKKAAGGWSDEFLPLIELARLQYDEGRVEMCQGRDGDWIILYVIPRRVPVVRHTRYFIIAEGYYYDRLPGVAS